MAELPVGLRFADSERRGRNGRVEEGLIGCRRLPLVCNMLRWYLQSIGWYLVLQKAEVQHDLV